MQAQERGKSLLPFPTIYLPFLQPDFLERKRCSFSTHRLCFIYIQKFQMALKHCLNIVPSISSILRVRQLKHHEPSTTNFGSSTHLTIYWLGKKFPTCFFLSSHVFTLRSSRVSAYARCPVLSSCSTLYFLSSTTYFPLLIFSIHIHSYLCSYHQL